MAKKEDEEYECKLWMTKSKLALVVGQKTDDCSHTHAMNYQSFLFKFLFENIGTTPRALGIEQLAPQPWVGVAISFI